MGLLCPAQVIAHGATGHRAASGDSAMAEPAAGFMEEAFTIRSAVNQGLGHRGEARGIDGARVTQIENAGDAAHVIQKHGLGDGAAAKKEVHAVCRSLFDRGLMPSAEFSSLCAAVAEGRGKA